MVVTGVFWRGKYIKLVLVPSEFILIFFMDACLASGTTFYWSKGQAVFVWG